MKEQVDQLRKVYYMNLLRNRMEKYSLIIICKEQTTFSNRYISELFKTPISGSTEIQAFQALKKDELFQKLHQRYINKLTEIGFRFV